MPVRCAVALRKESVDRNTPFSITRTASASSLSARRAWIEITVPNCAKRRKHVALRKESVDRNQRILGRNLVGTIVALRKESVDRNGLCLAGTQKAPLSLSARRAWIEIAESPPCSVWGAASLSARRAWIEIILSR